MVFALKTSIQLWRPGFKIKTEDFLVGVKLIVENLSEVNKVMTGYHLNIRQEVFEILFLYTEEDTSLNAPRIYEQHRRKMKKTNAKTRVTVLV